MSHFKRCLLVGVILIATHCASQDSCSSSELEETNKSTPKCEPRETVEFLHDSINRNVWYVPDQILIKKCSGSCQEGNLYHSCIPAQQTAKNYQVVVHQYGEVGGPICQNVQVFEDVECKCGCRISENDCLPSQTFNPSQCRCECKNQSAKQACFAENILQGPNGPQKVWREETCQCRCLEEFRECSTGYIYDSLDTCSCVAQYRPASHSATVILMVALVVCVGAIGFLLVRIRRMRLVIAKSAYSRSQSQAPKCEDAANQQLIVNVASETNVRQ